MQLPLHLNCMGMHRGEHVTEKQRLSLFKKLFFSKQNRQVLNFSQVHPCSCRRRWNLTMLTGLWLETTPLVSYVDTLCRALSTTPSRLMPDELFLSEVDFTNENFHKLQGELTTAQQGRIPNQSINEVL